MKQYTKVVKSMLRELGYNKVKVRQDSVMAADIENATIYLDKSWLEKNNPELKSTARIIKKLYKSYGWKIGVSMTTFAVLHELGHVLSKDNYENLDKELESYNHKQFILITKRLNSYLEMKEYRNLRLERDADRIAYKIYKKNKNIIKQYDKAIESLKG
jgi:hypothetical protein